ncbi:MAG: VWA domain-containing protein [Planctomycetota bacterium]|nr:MAG: VWA domain-containing protein [Planctomycetota bacterium]
MWSTAREVPAWAISLIVHALLLLLLASITQVINRDSFREPIVSEMLDEFDEQYKFDTVVVEDLGNDSDVNTISPSQLAATVVKTDPVERMERHIEETVIEAPAIPTSEVVTPNEAEFADVVDVRGATEEPGGVEGAIDRLTLEIAQSLKERKTLVIWLFDESGSMAKRRNAIADRFENIYRQLGMLDESYDKALKTAVVGFSDKTTFYTPDPVDDIRPLVGVIRGIKPSKSPKEMVFTAVMDCAKRWLKYRTAMRRNVLFIIVTDERGDDFQLVEDASAFLARYGMRVYCVGNASPFGRREGYIPYTYPDGYTIMAKVDQGPESLFPQRLNLPFWGVRSNDLRNMSSGFGPYALTRLCAETKGLFLITEQDRRYRFDPAIMRNYVPDYRPIRVVEKDVRSNLAKTALVQAAQRANVETITAPQLSFRADTDNILRQQITEAQKPLALLDYRLQELETILAAGEKDRPKIREPRWQAAYDLAMGRVLALRVRAYGYNVVLASMKASPKSFSNKNNNTWTLVPSSEVQGGPIVRKMAKRATEYLSRVIDQHAGTPWAVLAERELSTPMGWQWKETHVNYGDGGRNGKKDNKLRILFADDPKNPKKSTKMRAPVRRPPPAL